MFRWCMTGHVIRMVSYIKTSCFYDGRFCCRSKTNTNKQYTYILSWQVDPSITYQSMSAISIFIAVKACCTKQNRQQTVCISLYCLVRHDNIPIHDVKRPNAECHLWDTGGCNLRIIPIYDAFLVFRRLHHCRSSALRVCTLNVVLLSLLMCVIPYTEIGRNCENVCRLSH